MPLSWVSDTWRVNPIVVQGKVFSPVQPLVRVSPPQECEILDIIMKMCCE